MSETVPQLSRRVLVLAPTTRDGQITVALLSRAEMICLACDSMPRLIDEIHRGVGAILLTEEAITVKPMDELITVVNAQAAWSEIPVVLMMRGGVDSPAAARVLAALRNVTLLERPAPMRSVESAVKAALRFRDRQYQIRDQMEAIRTSEAHATDLQQQLEIAIEASNLGTFHCEMPLGKILWNDRCKAHFWLAPDAKIDFDLFYSILHADDRERTRQAVEACVYRGQPYDIEYRTVSPGGDIRWVRATGRTYRDLQGNPTRFDGTTIDITERKRIEQEREVLLESERAARTEAERANRTKDDFLATVSHELRTPLNAILGWTQLLHRGKSDAELVEEAVEVIGRNARLQAQLIEDLLDMSRIISGKIRLNVQVLSAGSVIDAAVKSVQPGLREKNIQIVLENRGEMLELRGDAGRLQQVIWNLLSNAVKFTPENGRIIVSLQRVISHAEIRVTDNGEGIDAPFLPFIFERFRQADSSMTRRHGGLGLGLAIVKQLVELHGGSVAAESAGRGLGSTFIIRLPLSGETAEMGQPLNPTGTALPDTFVRHYADLNGVRVLVVDDDPDARRLVKRLLSECGAQVNTAASDAEALELLQANRFDVLVSDIGMPGMDGYDFISRVRALDAPSQGVPAAAVTAFARVEDRQRALRAGYQRHVAKPIEPSELINVVAILAGRTHQTHGVLVDG